jgi:transcriptional regulator with XRE-family HTH domain
MSRREEISVEMNARNAELGRLLERARMSKNISMAACAAEINTSRQRYAAIERGSSFVSAVELERLFRLLDISIEGPWATKDTERNEQRVYRDIPVHVLPGEIIRVVIDANTPALTARAALSEAPEDEDTK